MVRWIRDAEKAAADKVRAELAKPDTEEDFAHDDSFAPWSLFPTLYGSYDSAFDDMAIEVLSELAAEPLRWDRDDLGAQMFREMLCTARLCDYGTSPRVCFPTPDFKELLPGLIKRWEAYRDQVWK